MNGRFRLRHVLRRIPTLMLVGSLAAACAGPPDSDSDTGVTDVGPDSGMPDDAATGGDDAGPDTATDQGESIEAAAQTWAEASCDRLERCSSDNALGWNLIHAADRDTCVDVWLESNQWFGADGVTVTADDLQACAAALDTLACDGQFPPDECDFRGALATGDSCVTGQQCESGICGFDDAESLCGTCTQRTAEGDPCLTREVQGGTVSYCTGTLQCGADDTCRQPVGIGESCDVAPCVGEATCIDDECVADASVDEACDPTDPSVPGCDTSESLTCGADGMCARFGYAAEGESCADVATGVLTWCAGPNYCDGDEVCAPQKGEGESCESGGRQCSPGLICSGGTCQRRMCG